MKKDVMWQCDKCGNERPLSDVPINFIKVARLCPECNIHTWHRKVEK
jgi:hypothetical protein